MFWGEWITFSCDKITAFLGNAPANSWTHQTLTFESTETSKSLSLLGGSPSSTLMLPSFVVHPTQYSFSHTLMPSSLGKKLCQWHRRVAHSCQLAEMFNSDKRGTSADCTRRSLFWAKYFSLSLQSYIPVKFQMFLATCRTSFLPRNLCSAGKKASMLFISY